MVNGALVVRRQIALLALGLLAAGRAQGTVAPLQPSWANPAPLPANGAIVLHGASPRDFAVTVTGSAGPVAGRVRDLGGSVAWRALEDLTPGRHRVHVGAIGEITALPLDFEVEAVSRYEPAPHELELGAEFSTVWQLGGTPVCCEPNPETRSVGRGCFLPSVFELRVLALRTTSPLPAEHANQYLYRFVEFPEAPASGASGIDVRPNDWLRQFRTYAEVQARPAHTAIDAPANEYCVALEAQSLIDDTTFTTRRCVGDPGSPLGSKSRGDYSGAFDVESCPIPPAGYEVFWCAETSDDCADATIARLADDVRALRRDQCENHAELCAPAPEASASAGSSSNCRVSPGFRARSTAAAWLSLVVLIAGFARRMRHGRVRCATS
jgi:hypothetical protein